MGTLIWVAIAVVLGGGAGYYFISRGADEGEVLNYGHAGVDGAVDRPEEEEFDPDTYDTGIDAGDGGGD